MKVKKRRLDQALASWSALNEFLLNATEEECLALRPLEEKGRCRQRFLLRIHSRYNRVRADREREEIAERLGG